MGGVSILNGRFLSADGPGFKKPVGRAVYLLDLHPSEDGRQKSSFAVPCQENARVTPEPSGDKQQRPQDEKGTGQRRQMRTTLCK